MNSNVNNSVENISMGGRASRALVGAALIGSVMVYDGGYLGWLAVLALIAVYPVFEAITGFSPLRAAETWANARLGKAFRKEQYTPRKLAH